MQITKLVDNLCFRFLLVLLLLNCNLPLSSSTTLLLKRNSQNSFNLTCVTSNASNISTLNWISNNALSESAPNNKQYDVIYNFTNSKHYIEQEGVSIRNSLNLNETENINIPIVFDYRWNDFPTYSIKNGQNVSVLSNKTVTTLYISLRYNSQVRVELRSEGDYYIAIIDNNQTGKILFKKENGKKVVNNLQTNVRIDSDQLWQHFVVYKLDEKFYIEKYSEDFENSNATMFDLQEFSVHGDVSYKVQDYNFLYVRSLSNGAFFQEISFQTDSCVCMFLSFCKTCTLQVSFDEYIWNITGFNKWTEEKFCSDNLKHMSNKFYFDKNVSVPLLIGNVRRCGKNDIYYSSIVNQSLQAKCQIISAETSTVQFKSVTNISVNNDEINSCNKFDKNFCEETIVCNEKHCYCSTGYTGPYCTEKCENNNWGDGCREKCSQGCKAGSCDHVSGKCDKGCLPQHTGDRCIANFKWNIEAGVNEITLSMKYFSSQYEIHMCNKMESCGLPKNSYNATHYKFKDLNPLQSYTFQLYEKEGDSNIIIATKNITTNCEAITTENLKITAKRELVTFTTSGNTSCPLRKYEITPQNYIIKHKNGAIEIINLEPYTNYTILMKANISTKQLIGNNSVSVTFLTDSAKPTVTVNSINATNTSITLTISSTMYGIFKNYNISYMVTKYKYCNKNNLTNLMLNSVIINEAIVKYTIKNLRPSATYDLHISAANKKYTGKPVVAHVNTLDSDDLFEEETKLDCLVNKTGIFVNLPNCEQIKGNVSYNIQLDNSTSTSEIIFNENYVYNDSQLAIYYSTLQLPAYKSYNLSLSVKKSGKFEPAIPSYCSFKTPPAEPGKVINFEAFSQHNDSIYLRWTPPHPETGKIQFYNITYYQKNLPSKCYNIITSHTCELWDNYICSELRSLAFNTSYNIEIQAKNEDVDTFGDNTSISATTVETASTAPENVTFDTHPDFSVDLFWIHPNKTNGKVTKFLITIDKNNSNHSTFNSIKHEFKISSYQKLYTAKVHDLKPSTTYNVFIQAQNSHEGMKSDVVSFHTYPPVPVIGNQVKYSCEAANCLLHLPRIDYMNTETKFYLLLNRKGKKTTHYSNSEKQMISRSFKPNEYIINIENISIKEPIKDFDYKINYNYSEFDIQLLIKNTYNGLETYSELVDVQNDNESQLAIIITSTVISVTVIVILLLTLGLLWKKYGMPRMELNRKPAPNENENENIPLFEFSGHKNTGEFLRRILQKNPDFVENEYLGIKEYSNQSSVQGLKTENLNKNRYKNVIPYDEHRVILKPNRYINASYIIGHNGPRTYIATQCPNEQTCYDFWQMVLQENTKIIICLATLSEGKKKMTRYWPNENETITFSDITIAHEQTLHETDYIKRVFSVSGLGTSNRRIYQMQYISWPDHDIPLYPLSFLEYLKCIKNAKVSGNSRGPVVVHCSAGIGRTGTYIMCDYLLEQTQNINVAKYLNEIRMHRKLLVSKVIQYKLIYFILDEHFNGFNRIIPHENLRMIDLRKNIEDSLKSHFDDALKRKYAYNFLYNTKSFSVEKQTDPITYYNTLNVHGYEKNNGFIVCKTHTDTDFWEMIYQENVRLIIYMQKSNAINLKYDTLWKLGHLIRSSEFLEILVHDVIVDDNSISYELHLFNSKNQDEWTIKLIQCYLPWKDSHFIPTDDLPLYNLYNEYLQSVQNTPTVLCCWDGVTGCGLFIALDLTIQKLKNDFVLDMYWLVNSLAQYNKYAVFIQSKHQLKCIYDMIIKYFLIPTSEESEPFYENTPDIVSELYQNV